MFCYHLRYNLYPAFGGPIEKEEWRAFNKPMDDSMIKTILQQECHFTVSVIHSSTVEPHIYEQQKEKQRQTNSQQSN